MIHCNALLLPNDYCLLKETKILFLQTGWYSFQIRWYSLSECESGKLWFSHSFLSRNYTIACKQLSSHNDTSEKEDWQGSTTLKKNQFSVTGLFHNCMQASEQQDLQQQQNLVTEEKELHNWQLHAGLTAPVAPTHANVRTTTTTKLQQSLWFQE